MLNVKRRRKSIPQTNPSDDQVKRAVSRNLEATMRQRNLNPYRLWKLSGENESTIARIIRRENVPTLGTIARIAAALGVSIDELMSVAESE